MDDFAYEFEDLIALSWTGDAGDLRGAANIVEEHLGIPLNRDDPTYRVVRELPRPTVSETQEDFVFAVESVDPAVYDDLEVLDSRDHD